MRVLILGASGLIGGNLLRLLNEENGYEAVGTYFSYQAKGTVKYNTLDPEDSGNFDVKSFQADVIVHCGALTWVDYCEGNREESFQKTVQSTVNALDLARTYNARFVFISTDYVFDGVEGPYREKDEVNAISVYGSHKLEAEKEVVTSGLDYLILRVTNVYGDEERGKNFIARLAQKAMDGAVENMAFPYDQYATPINAWDVARVTEVLMSDGKTGLYHLASTDYLNRYQLAMRVLSHFQRHNIAVRPISTSELAQAARRPLNGGLIASKFIAEYPDFVFSNVDDYVQALIDRNKQE